MRRANREVKSKFELIKIIEGCKVCRVGMVDNGKPYVIPLNFGYKIVDSVITIYLHSAKEGRKIGALTKNSTVCIEMDRMNELITGENGCNYSCYFESFIGEGQAVFLENTESKINALNAIMKHQTGRDDFSYDLRVLDKTLIIAIELSHYTGKRH